MALLHRGLVITFLIALSLNNAESQTIEPISPQCSLIEFYDTTQYECQPCPLNSKKDSSGTKISFKLDLGTSCKCQDGFIVQEDSRFKFAKTCTKCTGVKQLII
jgi:hypothetical protein